MSKSRTVWGLEVESQIEARVSLCLQNSKQVIIGLDTSEMVSEMESLAHLDDGSGFEDEDSDIDDDDDGEDEDDENGNYVKDWVSVLEDDEDFDGSVGDWEKFETMRSTHPIDFANQLADFVSDVPIDYMDRPPFGLAIDGLLRPAFVDEIPSSMVMK